MSRLDPKDFASLELVDSNLREIGRSLDRADLLLGDIVPDDIRIAVGKELNVIRQKAARARELVADVNVK